jgi:hypothetical protein
LRQVHATAAFGTNIDTNTRIKGRREPPGSCRSRGANSSSELTKGDKKKERQLEVNAAVDDVIIPVMLRLPGQVNVELGRYIIATHDGDLRRFIDGLLPLMPALSNYIDLMATVCQFPTRKDKINHFYDYEIMPVPLAYAAVFVSQDRGIKDLLRNKTDLLKRNSCRYCSDLGELEDWLKAEMTKS